MRTALVNIGCLLSGDPDTGTIDADAIEVDGGVITALGDDVDRAAADRVIDVRGATVGPGLIDSHCHVVIGDYTPRQSTVGFIASYVHGGITRLVSPGEIHLPGRPRDAVGVKALAVLAQRSWAVVRPNGMKVLGGSLVMEPTLREDDFAAVAADGVRLAKFGFGLYPAPLDGLDHIRAAQKAGILVTCHSGGASIPGSKPITADDLFVLRPDICGHVNGGPTSLEEVGVERLVRDTDVVLQLVQAGCLRSAIEIANLALEVGAERRVIVGSDTPTGTGVMPLGVLKTLAELCSLAGVDPALAWAWASGVSADVYGLPEGRIALGRPADLCVSDAPWGSSAADTVSALRRGDIPAVSVVLIDGEIRVAGSRNTPPPARPPEIDPPPGELPGSAHVA